MRTSRLGDWCETQNSTFQPLRHLLVLSCCGWLGRHHSGNRKQHRLFRCKDVRYFKSCSSTDRTLDNTHYPFTSYIRLKGARANGRVDFCAPAGLPATCSADSSPSSACFPAPPLLCACSPHLVSMILPLSTRASNVANC